jgi:flagellar L-ring protein precursor FlgH
MGKPVRGALMLACVAVMLAGCSHVGHKPLVDEAPPIVVPPAPPPRANGAIFQAAGGHRPLFEDRRPRFAGDLLTIVFDEQVSATRNANSSANRNSASSFTPDVVPTGLKKLNKLEMDVKAGQDFKGGGSAKANNTFTGTMTVTVVRVLNNGNLRVRGEKQIAINKGTEFIRFAGTVDPRAISPDDSVLSSRVADARIEYVGEGYISDAQRMGWLQHLMLKVWPF